MNPTDEECYFATDTSNNTKKLATESPVDNHVKESFGIKILSIIAWILLAIISLGAIPLIPLFRKLRKR